MKDVKLKIQDDEWSDKHKAGYKKTVEKCIFCKKKKCVCGPIDLKGYVQLELNECKTIGDLANLRRDKFSKTEKERADHEYAASSTLAAKKLADEKSGNDGSFLGASAQKLKELGKASPEKLQKYVATGEL